MMVNRRRRMLTWMRQADFDSYSYAVTKLGLQDIYSPIVGGGARNCTLLGAAFALCPRCMERRASVVD